MCASTHQVECDVTFRYKVTMENKSSQGPYIGSEIKHVYREFFIYEIRSDIGRTFAKV